ncbi:MAG: sugar phosphate isomerase/epimerase family protein [Terriglobia bacterium]
MLTRRSFLRGTLGGIAVGAAAAGNDARAAGRLAWPGPIGLELYTVRQLLAQNSARTIKQVAEVGYKVVEAAVWNEPDPAAIMKDIRADGLTAPSGYVEVPKNLDPDWKTSVDSAHQYGMRYIVVGDNARLDAEQWRRRADFFNQCGRVSHQAGIQFCYHAHFNEFYPVDHTTGYDILLEHCPPKHLQMEMDIFWVVYAGKDPLTYWRRYPGRFPLLHIKDLRKGISVHHFEDPSPTEPNPFVPVGQGRIDWRRIFAHVNEAGAKYIFVEQDRCDGSPLTAIKISYHYLRNLRLS